MAERLKPLEEMDLIDDFLNNAVASCKPIGEEIFRIILEVLLEREIGAIDVQNQVVISAASPDLRGVRLDVEIREKDEGGNVVTVYDYEPHTAFDMDFPLANRFRQSKIDSKSMKAGDRIFEHMPELFIITITNFDIFGEGKLVYTVHNRFEELPDKEYRDKLKFIYFNTTGNSGGSTAIKNMLTYIQKSTSVNAVDEATSKVDSLVSRVKNLEEVRSGYMTFGDKYALMMEEYKDEYIEKGRLIGRAEQEEQTRIANEQTRIERERADKAEAELKMLRAKLQELDAAVNS